MMTCVCKCQNLISLCCELSTDAFPIIILTTNESNLCDCPLCPSADAAAHAVAVALPVRPRFIPLIIFHCPLTLSGGSSLYSEVQRPRRHEQL